MYHTEVRWLSRGKDLVRAVQLRAILEEIVKEKGSPLADLLSQPKWVMHLCYLVYIFAEVSAGNLCL